MSCKKSDSIINIPQDPLNVADPRGVGVLLFERMKRFGDKIGLIDAETGQSQTYSEILLRTIRVAEKIKAEGITSEDVVVLCPYNTLNSNLPFYACIFLGIRIATIDPSLPLSDVKHLLNITKPRLIFSESDTINVMQMALNDIDLNSKLVSSAEHENCMSFSEFLQSSGNEKNFQPTVPKSLRDTVVILFSSGTTGLSKGICMHHYGLMVQQYNFKRNLKLDVCLSFTTLYWISSVILFFTCSLNGKARVMCRKFEENFFMEVVQKYKVNCCFMAPILTYKITRNINTKKYDTTNLKSMIVGGGVLATEQHKLLRLSLPHTDILISYGMTELHGLINIFDQVVDRDFLDSGKKLKSCGTAVPGISYKIVNVDSGEIVGPNTSGEIRLKAACITEGYHSNKAESLAMWDNEGYFCTGDIGYYDEDNCFYVVDRIKEMLKFQSWHILPNELENILLSHPNVTDAAVIGIPHEIDGDHPAGYVTITPGSNIKKEEILHYFNGKVSDKKQLRGGLRIIEAIPKTPSGKLKKRDLPAMEAASNSST